jgi:hypothetical protein
VELIVGNFVKIMARQNFFSQFQPSLFYFLINVHPLYRVRLLEGWQSGWDGSDMGRYAYSIWPVVSFMPWFKCFDSDRVIKSMITRKIGK